MPPSSKHDFNSKGPIQSVGGSSVPDLAIEFQFQRSNSETVNRMTGEVNFRISIPKVQFRVIAAELSGAVQVDFNSKGPIQSRH